MDLLIDGEEWYISKTRLDVELKRYNLLFLEISEDGEMKARDLDTNRIEVYMARPTGYPNAFKWGGMDFEFCRSEEFA